MSKLTIIKNIKQIVTMEDFPQTVRDGQGLGIFIEKDKILEIAPFTVRETDAFIIDAGNSVILPGLIDCHTHPVFAGDRCFEFEARIQGKTYQQIASEGGGILKTVKATRKATFEELLESAKQRITQMMAFGVTVCEAKSGYGLDLDSEIKILRVLKELKRTLPIEIIPTFMGAHEIPPEFKTDRTGYLALLTDKMIPAVAREGLAEFCDIFCEEGVFTISESRNILNTAKSLGLKLKLHADEFVNTGGFRLAEEVGATSADHLMAISQEDIKKMKNSSVVPVLLPGTTFYLNSEKYAPARMLLDEGFEVAIASDFNPGSCMTNNLLLIGSIACIKLRLTPLEVLMSLTRFAAKALGLDKNHGIIKKSFKADISAFNVPDFRYILYHYGVNHLKFLMKNGELIVQN